MKKIFLSILLVCVMAASLLTGCSGNGKKAESTGGSDTKDTTNDTAQNGTQGNAVSNEEPYHATLMYFVASDSKDQSLVNDAVNKLAKEQLNMTIDLIPITIGSYMQQIQLMLSGGESLDVFPIFANNASTYVESQYVVNLAPMIEEKGKDILKVVGKEDVWCSSIGDFLWGITTMRERANPSGLVVRTDILNETGIKAEDLKTMDDITALYAKVKELHPEMICYGGTNTATIPQILNVCDTLADGYGVLADNGQTTTVSNWYESDVFRSYVDVMRNWYQKGYSSQDLPTSTDSGEALMKAGNLFSFSLYYKPNTKQEKDDQTGYDTTLIPITQPLLTTTTTSGLGYGIANNSENPEKAMELLNWLYSNGEVNDLLNWGIEGKHWVLQNDGTLNYPEGITIANCGYHQNFGFAIPNQFAAHVWAGNDPKVFDKYADIRKNAVTSKAYGFTYSSAEVLNELAAVTAVKEQYLNSICSGSVDPETTISEFNKALYNAGLQKIIDAKQKQLNDWLSNNK